MAVLGRLLSDTTGSYRPRADIAQGLLSARTLKKTDKEPRGSKMDFIFDILINLLAHRIGVYVLGLLSGGRFKGESGFAWGWAVAVGGLVLFAPFVVSIALLIHTSGG
ncbi:hypothetical protein [Pseudomonas farris]